MTKLEWSETLGRMLRKDDWDELGVPTSEKLKEAIAAGRTDWVWALLTWVARTHGEEEAGQALVESAEAWARPRYGFTYEIPAKMSVEERVQQTVEAMHTHLPFNPNGKP